jgi:hypothetical protein
MSSSSRKPAIATATSAAAAAEAAEARPDYRRAQSRGRHRGEAGFEGIGVFAESGLHAALKAAYARPGDRTEAAVDGKIIDLVRRTARGEELVEIQTKRLDKIQAKVLALAEGHRVRLVHPLFEELRIVRLSPETGEILSERKSPRHDDLFSVFDELVRATALINARNVTLEVVLVSCREIRCRDGKGSWRRKGDTIVARDLEEIRSSRVFGRRGDWMGIFPKDLPPPWSSASLGEALGIGADRARRILYSYAAAGLLAEAGREGRRKLYAPARLRAR